MQIEKVPSSLTRRGVPPGAGARRLNPLTAKRRDATSEQKEKTGMTNRRKNILTGT